MSPSSLERYCRGLDDWPRSWHVEPADIIVGQQIVQVLTPFLLHLLDLGLAKTTVRRHRDNLWALGGELIRCRTTTISWHGWTSKTPFDNSSQATAGH